MFWYVFLLTFSFLSIYSCNGSFENKGLFTKTTSSTNSTRSASCDSLCSCLLRFNTCLFHLSLVFPGSLDIRLQSTSGVSSAFHCCRDMMLSHLMRKFLICKRISLLQWCPTFDLFAICNQYSMWVSIVLFQQCFCQSIANLW